MAKTKISLYDPVAANNTDINSINIAEGMAPSDVNNAIRELMAELKQFQAGTAGDNLTVGGNLIVTGTSTLSGISATTITNTPAGNIAATTVQAAINELDGEKAKIGANSDITSLTGLTTPLSVAQGGVGANTHTLNSLLLGNGTSALLEVAPSTSGNVLKSNGTTWQSVANTTLTSGTAVASTSGTSIDFTGIPSTVKRVTVIFNGVSNSGTSHKLVQLGSGTIQATGYISASANVNSGVGSIGSTIGLIVNSPLAVNAINGMLVISLVSGNIWVSSHTGNSDALTLVSGGGSVTLAGALDRLRITTVNGTDTFDAGSINIMWE